MNAAVWPCIALAWLWPFGGDDPADEQGDGTIKSLEEREVGIESDEGIEASQQKAIESYRAFLELAFDDPMLRAEAMRRLADLQLEASEERRIREQLLEMDDSDYGNAVQLYQQLLRVYPDYEHNDRVLYQLARAYENNTQAEAALETLDTLVGRYPATAHWSEAQFRRGEILFMAKRYDDAEQAYRAVLTRGPDAAFYEQSLYKHGWSMFKQVRHDEGIESFLELLDRRLVTAAGTLVDIEAMTRPERELLDDTFRVVSVSFSYMNGAEAIEVYLADRPEVPYAYLLYTDLGRLYLDKERYTDAAETFRAYVDRDPLDLRAPLLLVQVITAYKQADFPSLVLESKKEFVERYGLDAEFWRLHGRDAAPEVLVHLKSNVLDLARHYHALAQANKKPAAYREAARWYRSYLRYFPDDPEAPASNFLLAEILFESGQYREATQEYERTAYAYPFHDKGAEAGYAALLAYKRHADELEGVAGDEWHRASIDSALRFAATYPDHEQAGKVLTRAAEELFALGEFERAIDTAGRVIAKRPPVDAAKQRVAWTVIAHSQFDLGRYADAEAAYLQVQALMPRDDPEWQNIVERIASAIYKQGEAEREAGQLAAAVNHFQRVSRATPGSAIVATADYDAAAALLQLQDWSRATGALEDFRSAHPDHELQGEVTRSLAVAYLEAQQPAEAAAEFERIAAGSEDGIEVRREAQWRAAELYEEAGQAQWAIAAFETFVQRYPAPVTEAIEARQRLADLTLAQGDGVRHYHWLDEIIRADAAAGAESTDRTRTLAARAALELAQPSFEAFAAVRLSVPLQDSLKVKKERMEHALHAYTRAADYRVSDVTTAATYHIAEIYHQFSIDVFESERPPGLSPEELEQYEILLEEQAYPFEEKAIDIHEANTRRTRDGVYDEWVQKSFYQLAQLVPVRYAKAEKSENIVQGLH